MELTNNAIAELRDCVDIAYNTIAEKGGEVPENRSLVNLPDAIGSIKTLSVGKEDFITFWDFDGTILGSISRSDVSNAEYPKIPSHTIYGDLDSYIIHCGWSRTIEEIRNTDMPMDVIAKYETSNTALYYIEISDKQTINLGGMSVATNVDFGDGCIEEIEAYTEIVHMYQNSGKYIVKIHFKTQVSNITIPNYPYVYGFVCPFNKQISPMNFTNSPYLNFAILSDVISVSAIDNVNLKVIGAKMNFVTAKDMHFNITRVIEDAYPRDVNTFSVDAVSNRCLNFSGLRTHIFRYHKSTQDKCRGFYGGRFYAAEGYSFEEIPVEDIGKVIWLNIPTCSGVREIVIPHGVTNLYFTTAYGGYHYLTRLTRLALPDTLRRIEGNYIFYGGKYLSELHIPMSVTYISTFAFGQLGENLTEAHIYIHIQDPNNCTLASTNSFPKSNKVKIHIPKGTLDLYKNATNWSYFNYIDDIEQL